MIIRRFSVILKKIGELFVEWGWRHLYQQEVTDGSDEVNQSPRMVEWDPGGVIAGASDQIVHGKY